METIATFLLKILIKLNLTKPLLTAVNSLGIKNHLVDGDHSIESDIRRILESKKAGDAILTRAFGEVTTALQDLQGKDSYTHTAVVSHDNNYIIDATSIGVKHRDILKLFIGCSAVKLIRPKLTEQQRERIADRAEFYAAQDIEYDYNFLIDESLSGKKEMFCSELYYFCIDDVVREFLPLSKLGGEFTITPQDLADSDKFETIVEIKASK